jgi:Transposase DDE domain
VLFYDDVVVAYLLAFFNPTLRSLRCIEQASQLPAVNRHLNVRAVCRSTLADANALFDPELLQGLIGDLRDRLPNLRQQDRQLHALLERVIVHDGSFFRVAADVAWAVGSANQHGDSGPRRVRLNCRFCLKGGVPRGVSINGSDGVGEGAAAIALIAKGNGNGESQGPDQQIYLFDGGVVSFDLLKAILAKGSHFLCNLAPGVKFQAHAERPLSDQDRAAGVVSDRVGRLAGSDRRQAPAADTPVREVVISYVDRTGAARTLRLLTTLLTLPAHLVGELYRHRWQVELFFRWLKCHASFAHLTSHSRNGITLGFYVAVIAAMLLCLHTRRPLSKYGYNLLAMVAAGLGDVADALPILEEQERRSQLERERLARKRAAADEKTKA